MTKQKDEFIVCSYQQPKYHVAMQIDASNIPSLSSIPSYSLNHSDALPTHFHLRD